MPKVVVTEEMVQERHRWLLGMVSPYIDRIVSAFLRARSPMEYGDMLSAPDGFTSREFVTRLVDARARMVASWPVPPVALEHEYEFYSDDPRITLDARMGAWVLTYGRSTPGFPSLPGVEDGWHLREDARDLPGTEPLEVRYQRELEALGSVDPDCEWVTGFVRSEFAEAIGKAVMCPELADSYRSSISRDRSLEMLQGAIVHCVADQVLPGLNVAAKLVDIVAWLAVRSGKCVDLVAGATYARKRVLEVGWPPEEDHASFIHRARMLGDIYYNGSWRKELYGVVDEDETSKGAQAAKMHLQIFEFTAGKLAEIVQREWGRWPE